MTTPPIELELRKLGLTEKEARVYLAGLELGPSSVKKIAEAAKITRPTAYETIKKLEEKKLFEESKQNKKRAFAARPPERILGILKIQKREIEEKERELARIIAALDTKESKGKKRIETFKGPAGIKSLEEMISFSSTPNIIIINPRNLPIGTKQRKKIYRKIKKRLGKLEIKEINSKISGGLIIFDKVALFRGKKEAFLLF